MLARKYVYVSETVNINRNATNVIELLAISWNSYDKVFNKLLTDVVVIVILRE